MVCEGVSPKVGIRPNAHFSVVQNPDKTILLTRVAMPFQYIFIILFILRIYH